MTVGTLFLIFAAVDLALGFVFGTAVARRQEELAPEKRSPAPYFIIGGGFVTAAIFCFLAFSLPEADLLVL